MLQSTRGARTKAKAFVKIEDRHLGGHASRVCLRMFGPLSIEQAGKLLELPASRKVCGLVAYLAVSRRPVSRERLCELLWDDAASDPRGELRWCLSKLRRLLGDAEGHTLIAEGDAIALRTAGWFIDALEVSQAVDRGLASFDIPTLQSLSDLYRGEVLEGLVLARSPEFNLWLTTLRSRYSAIRVDLLKMLVERLPAESPQGLAALETWAEIAPCNDEAQTLLLTRLAERGRIDAGKRHLAAAEQLYRAERLDFTPVREAWRDLSKARAATAAAAPAQSVSPRVDGDAFSPTAHRPSLAVMPLRALQDGDANAARSLTHDVITRLAKLRSFFVIAEGSMFALGEQRIGPQEAARRLNVEYVADGSVTRRSGRLVVAVELIEAASGRILWSEDFDRREEDIFAVIEDVGNQIVAAIANEIEAVERNCARLRPPESLDAWQAYHRGLWHMYRFTRAENDVARSFFERAATLDPTFARAHAGLSFTHWQDAFQHWGDRKQAVASALENAGRALLADEFDPTAHWAMGRAQWLFGRHDAAVDDLKQSVRLSPNFALGHYALAFVQSQSGDPSAAIEAADYSRILSPFDPLLFGILGSRAMALVRLKHFEEAATWSVRAAAQPNAHVLILAIAALCHALAGKIDDAQIYAAAIRTKAPRFGVDDYLTSFQFSADAAGLFRQAAQRIGLA